jgi:hypothetical protein
MSEPSIIFIVPYRNRKEQRIFFLNYMKYILEDYEDTDYKIVFIEQSNDGKPFNRGAMKNIGLLAVKDLYPKTYMNKTLVFNDVDTIPHKKGLLEYKTISSRVKHFFGTQQALGGIVSINAGDFERIGGFPNYWGWGYEDNVLQARVLQPGSKLKIDRSQFHSMNDQAILHLFDGEFRNLDMNTNVLQGNTEPSNTLQNITQLEYEVIRHNSSSSLALDYTSVSVKTFDVKNHPPSKTSLKSVNLLKHGKVIGEHIKSYQDIKNRKIGMKFNLHRR